MGDLLTHALEQGAQVMVVGLLLGAGLPTLFALGLRAYFGQVPTAAEAHAAQDEEPPKTATGASRPLGYLYFSVVIAAALFGIVVIIFGNRIFG